MKKILLLLLTVFLACPWGTVNAVAEDTGEYTSVMEDLQKDESFREKDYPSIGNNYTLQVIQLAESTAGEVFVYVYQPSNAVKDLTATSINISTAINDSLKYVNYPLAQISTYGVFDKYKVENLSMNADMVRYYSISSIFRAYDEEIDEAPSTNTENRTEEVAYEVGQEWHACTVNGEVTYSMITSEVVTVTNKVVGYIEYSEGFKLYIDRCDSHFVAFKTDREIERLMEADVYYVTQSYSCSTGLGLSGEPTIGEETDNYAYLTYTDVASNDADGWFGKKYSWNRIESVSTFIANEGEDLNLTTGDIEDLAGMDWILRFAETDHTGYSGYGSYTVFKTLVSKVTILRLKFETDGKTYNLGVVDNKTTGDDEPFASADTAFDDLWEELQDLIIGGLALVILLVFVCALFPSVVGVIAKGVWWLITLPFKLIGKLFKKRKGDKKE